MCVCFVFSTDSQTTLNQFIFVYFLFFIFCHTSRFLLIPSKCHYSISLYFTQTSKLPTMCKDEVIVVTGGSGFLGQHIVHLLQTQENSIKEIRIFDVKPYKKFLGCCFFFLLFCSLLFMSLFQAYVNLRILNAFIHGSTPSEERYNTIFQCLLNLRVKCTQ